MQVTAVSIDRQCRISQLKADMTEELFNLIHMPG